MEDQVEQQKNHEEHDGQDQLKTLLGPQFKLVFSRPMEGVVRGKRELLMQELVSLCNETPIVGVFEIDVDVSGECAVLITDHRRAVGERYFGHLAHRNLRPRWSSDEHALHTLGVVTKIPL